MTKLCAVCGTEKELSEFEFNGNGNRRRDKCKKCRNRARWPGSEPKKLRKANGEDLFCSRCERFRPVSDFNKKSGYGRQYHAWCKPCNAEYNRTPERRKRARAYRQENKDKLYDVCKRFRKENPVRAAWLGLKNRANRIAGVKLTLTYDDFVSLMSAVNCPICNVQMLEKGSHGKHDNDMKSVDRVRAGGDYSPDNCVCICKRCNQIKNSGTAEEHIAIGQWMLRQQSARPQQDLAAEYSQCLSSNDGSMSSKSQAPASKG